MLRSLLAGFALAVCCLGQSALAGTTVTGGGSVLASYDYAAEITAFNAASPPMKFSKYLPNVDSTVGLVAFFADDYTCDQNASNGANGGQCSYPIPGWECCNANISSPTDFDANDFAIPGGDNPDNPPIGTIEFWAISWLGQSGAANLIELPSMGFGVAIPIVNKLVTANGIVTLSDAALCGIFSGQITDFSQITGKKGKLKPGPITVVYRTDAAVTSWVLTAHLSAVCTTVVNGTPFFTAQSKFAAELAGNGLSVPANFVGVSGSRAVADYLAGRSGTRVTSAIGYIEPGFTTLFPSSSAVLSDRKPSPLLVAAIFQGRTSMLPTAANVTTGLEHPDQGSDLMVPRTAAAGANPANWTPIIQTTSAGYPIVGYTYFNFVQCYANPKVARSIVKFLTTHYSAGTAQTTQTNNGFVPVANTSAAPWITTIANNILANSSAWNIDIEDPLPCAGLAGR